MIGGARLGRLTPWRRLFARAQAASLTGFLVPGLEVAQAHGLDLARAGLEIVATPRHARVLVLVGGIPDGLARAAAVVYAQMPRPRSILALGTGGVPALPAPDVAVAEGQEALASGVADLRRRFAEGSFGPEAAEFDLAAVRTRTEYTCPMHPEVVQAEPGSCPICHMDLVPRQAVGEPTEHAGMAEHEGGAANGEHGGMDHQQMGHGQMSHEQMEHEVGQDPAETAAEEYTCPMHPEVVTHEPGICPICKMRLVPREQPAESEQPATEYICPMHPEVVSDEPGICPICKMRLVPREGEPAERHHDRGTAAPSEDAAGSGPARGGEPHGGTRHSSPDEIKPPGGQHAEHAGHAEHDVARGAPAGHEGMAHGDMAQGDAEQQDARAGEQGQEAHAGQSGHAGMEHGAHGDANGSGHGGEDEGAPGGGHGMEHGAGGFMSMVAMTKDVPRSEDGLPMEWVEAPFGPLFPSLPGGLDLSLTLDGDTVTRAAAHSRALERGLSATWPGAADGFADRVARLNPLAPAAYRLLALRALESAWGVSPDRAAGLRRIGALERERAASHLAWLALFGHLIGDEWLAGRAGALGLGIRRARTASDVLGLQDEVGQLARRVGRTPLLGSRLRGVGRISEDLAADLVGPVARAAGAEVDARLGEPLYSELGFRPLVGSGDDALGRLQMRLGEVEQSLRLVQAAAEAGSLSAGSRLDEVPPAVEGVSRQEDAADRGVGEATVETPRGAARLTMRVADGRVVEARVETPSARLADLVKPVAVGRELADALVGVASLDLSPWEMSL